MTEAKINESGGLSADLRYALDGRSLDGSARLESFDMTVVQPYLDRYTRMDLLSGLLTTELEVTLLADGGFAAAGTVQVDKLRTVDKAQKEDFIKWNMLRAEGFSYDGREAKLRIKTLRMRAPYARVIIAEDETINIAEIMKPATPAPAYVPSVELAAPGGPPPAETQVAIDTVSIENGSANFADFWIQPNYAVSLQSMNGTIVGLSSDPASRAKLDLEGKVDRYAPATIAGEMNLLSATLFTDIRVQFAGVDMTSVTPYSGRFAGYKIEKGKLSIDVTYHVENRAARRQAEIRDRPAAARGESGKSRCREPAAQAGGCAAEGPEWRHRHRPADDRQPRRPEIPARAPDLEGLRRATHQDRDRAIRAARQALRRR